MADLSDADLMRRVRTGDRPAFGVLVERYKDPLVNYLSKITGCRERAEDVAQETFLRLFRSAPRYREQGRLSGYVYRIATNLVRQEDRRRRRWRLVAGALRGQVEPGRPEAPARMLGSEAGRELARALAGLPLRYRVPLVLRDVEGWAYADIARATGWREGTVKSRISRGRGLLRQALEPYWSRGETLVQRPTA